MARGYIQFGCRRRPRYERTSIFEIVPADGHFGCQLEEAKTSVRRRFLGSSSDKPSACLYTTKMGMPEIKNNSGHLLLYRAAVWPTWSIATALDRRRLTNLTISSAILIPYTFGSSISRVVGGRHRATEPISSRHCDHFLRGPLSPLLNRDFGVGKRGGRQMA